LKRILRSSAKNYGSFTAYLSIFDLGSLVNVKIKGDTTSYSGLSFQQFLSPGLGFFWNIPKSPVSVGLYACHINNLYDIKYSNGAVTANGSNKDAWRFGVTALIDIPFYTLHNKPASPKVSYTNYVEKSQVNYKFSPLNQSYDSTNYINLENYCPTQFWQYKSTCYAYAFAHTALTMEYCLDHKFKNPTDVNLHAFSPGYIASQTRIGKNHLFNYCCGFNGNLNNDVKIVETYGCPFYIYFGDRCSNKINQRLIDEAKKITIKTSTHIYVKDSITNDTKIKTGINNIKKSLQDKHPVIIAINELGWFYYNKKEKIVDFSNKKEIGDHDVCIIGFDDRDNSSKIGCFYVKNNFSDWGNNGFSWVKYEELMNIITDAMVITIKDRDNHQK